MIRTAFAIAVAALLTVSPVLAGAELVLANGSRVSGSSLDRRGEEFVLITAEGAKLVIPRELVAEIHLTGGAPASREHRPHKHDEAARQERPPLEAPGPTRFEPRADEQRHGPSAESERLPETGGAEKSDSGSPSGPPSARTPGVLEQLAAFGDPASFPRANGDPVWRYDDVLGYDSDVTRFNPTRWARPAVNPVWEHEDELGYRTDETWFNPADWQSSSAWWFPSDGWSRGSSGSEED